MGVTVHWVDERTLERRSSVLCCRRFISPHDAEAIATLLNSIYIEFNIFEKVLCTVTDNASNFVKAFKKFGISFQTFAAFADLNAAKQNSEYELHDDDSVPDEEEDADVSLFVDIGDDAILSSHFRCGPHTLCRVASKDAEGAFADAKYAEIHESAFRKINSLYKCTNRPKSSENHSRYFASCSHIASQNPLE